MLNKILNQFGDLDPKKVVHVVDMIWDNRSKFMTLIEDLPEMLQKAGDGIEAAGKSALTTSVMLVGGGEKPGASAISELAAEALENAQKELTDVGGLLERLGGELDGVNIPSFKPDYSEVMGIKVMSGVDVGENKLIDNAADKLQSGATRLGAVGDDLERLAQHLRDLGATLDDAGKSLDSVGNKLMGSGDSLRALGNFDSK